MGSLGDQQYILKGILHIIHLTQFCTLFWEEWWVLKRTIKEGGSEKNRLGGGLHPRLKTAKGVQKFAILSVNIPSGQPGSRQPLRFQLSLFTGSLYLQTCCLHIGQVAFCFIHSSRHTRQNRWKHSVNAPFVFGIADRQTPHVVLLSIYSWN